MVKPTDFSKFRKNLTKSVDGISVGFHDPDTWISTGNYCLNYRISGRFDRGIPLGMVSMLAGESGCLPKSSLVDVKHEKIEAITVEELKELYNKHDVYIDTPDGLQKITDWFDKGKMSICKIKSETYCTRCADTHMIETLSESRNKSIWKFAKDLVIGDKVLTKTGYEKVVSIEKQEPEECYDFTVNHINHRYWGDGISSHNSGKSYVAANAMKNAQKDDIFVVAIDSENGLTQEWLKSAGVDTSEDKFMRIQATKVDDVAKTIDKFMEDYKAEYKDVDPEERLKVLFVIDSLGMLVTNTEIEQFKSGDLKGDMGRKAKALKALVQNCVVQFAEWNIGLIATNHSYQNQSMFSTGDIISGGRGAEYASSIVVTMQKLKLKENEEGEKTSEVHGIRSKVKCEKTRFCKPFESVEIKIPYEGGMDPYSGLIEFFEQENILQKDGNKLKYIDLEGKEHKYFRKRIPNDLLLQMMNEFYKKIQNKKLVSTESEEVEDTENTE